ncbi:hypothetical protein KP509_13G027500 [Ceratopteris richardii]|uniref:Chromo domain-containing protein n=1 Tax=Ceratopteris richardii TaxID=49495 RepID=A0A8T2TCD5_CERRI|nr:hypothetical protein KP509_13G027500 [Ceratopteris richardii]
MAHFIPTTKAITGATTTMLFLKYIFRLHGLSDDIVSDRGFGPFTILAKIKPVTFKLQLPSTMRIHPVFHVSMLEPYQISTLRGERLIPSLPIVIDDHEEFEVEHVLDSKISLGRLEYLIHWKGYDISDRTWVPAENLQRAPIKV